MLCHLGKNIQFISMIAYRNKDKFISRASKNKESSVTESTLTLGSNKMAQTLSVQLILHLQSSVFWNYDSIYYIIMPWSITRQTDILSLAELLTVMCSTFSLHLLSNIHFIFCHLLFSLFSALTQIKSKAVHLLLIMSCCQSQWHVLIKLSNDNIKYPLLNN
jgi:hypothetical protein